MSTVPIKTYSKASVERRRLYLDYSCWLEDAEKLTDTQVTITPYTSGGPLTATSAYSDSTNKKLVMFISGGVANTNYTVSTVVTTDAGQVKKDDIGIRVVS
jgi:hypothetical protein